MLVLMKLHYFYAGEHNWTFGLKRCIVSGRFAVINLISFDLIQILIF